MPEAHVKPRRRWFQFSLRTLLIAVMLVAGLLVAWRAYVEPYRRQREVIVLIEELRGSCKTESADKWLRWVYGDDFQNIVLVDLADCDDPQAYLERVAALPCLETLVVGGKKFGDEHLARLNSADTLRGLVLDSTSVTDTGIDELKRAVAGIVVHRSQRRAIAAWGEDVDIELQVSEIHLKLRRIVGDDEYFIVATEVGLRGRNVGDSTMADLKELTTLKLLDLSNTNVGDAELVHLKELPDLRYLGLNATQVSDAGLVHLRELIHLYELDLRQSQVTDAGLAHLKVLPNLRVLFLDGMQLSDVGLTHVNGVPKLKALWVFGAKMNNAGLQRLRGLTKLKNLYLKCPQVTDAGMRELQMAMPNCKIQRNPPG